MERYQVIMKDLHPDEEGGLCQQCHQGMFLEKEDNLAAILQSQQFEQLLKTNATTSEGQEYVAEKLQDKQTLYSLILSCSVL